MNSKIILYKDDLIEKADYYLTSQTWFGAVPNWATALIFRYLKNSIPEDIRVTIDTIHSDLKDYDGAD